MLCHSWSLTMDWCEYNLLNRKAAPVRHIEARSEQQPQEEWFRRDERYRPEHGDSMMTDEERTTTKIVMSETTLQTMTGEETIEGT